MKPSLWSKRTELRRFCQVRRLHNFERNGNIRFGWARAIFKEHFDGERTSLTGFLPLPISAPHSVWIKTKTIRSSSSSIGIESIPLNILHIHLARGGGIPCQRGSEGAPLSGAVGGRHHRENGLLGHTTSLNTQGLMCDAVAFGSTKSLPLVLSQTSERGIRAARDITKSRFLILTVSAYVF